MRRLVRLCTQVALAMTFAIALIVAGLWARGRLSAGEALLQLAYPAAYLLAYPPLLAALARLERAQCFAAVGRAEGASVLVEFGLPAALLGLGLPFWAGFAVSAVAARLLRAAMLALAARGSNLAESGSASAATETAPTRSLLKEGAGVQAMAALSMLRDQMHLWLVAPWFGAAWAGSYSFAYAAGMVVSQVAVQTAARVSLPQLRELDPSRRWARVLSQTRWLAIATLPPLALLPAWLAQADRLWWDGRWSLAVQITFWVALRMVAGVATTTLGNWLLVARDPWQSARANASWTAVEIALATAMMALIGPIGLAVSGVLAPWAGVAWMLAAASPADALKPRLQELTRVLLTRPSAWSASALGLWVWLQPAPLQFLNAGVATLLLPLCWLSEPALRHSCATWWRRQLPGAPSAAMPPAASSPEQSHDPA
jgi:hypothetical protein